MSEVEKKPTAAGDVIQGKKVKEVIPLKGMRKVMAEHMQRSLQESAQMTQFCLVEMTEMIKLRKELLSQEKETGIHYTYTDLFIKAVAESIVRYPLFNSSLIGDQIIIWDDINVGVALSYQLREGGSGLVVPAVRNADKKSLVEIHESLQDLVERGRSNRLRTADVTGVTFTISNVGVFGGGKLDVGYATVILDPPQIGLIVTGPIMDEPVVRDGQIVVRPIMKYSFTHDHRVVVAEDVITFLSILHEYFENPRQLLPS